MATAGIQIFGQATRRGHERGNVAIWLKPTPSLASSSWFECKVFYVRHIRGLKASVLEQAHERDVCLAEATEKIEQEAKEREAHS